MSHVNEMHHILHNLFVTQVWDISEDRKKIAHSLLRKHILWLLAEVCG